MSKPAGTVDVLLRCDGGHEMGLGHVKRCLAIARVLRETHGLVCVLGGRFDDDARDVIAHAGFESQLWSKEDDEDVWLEKAIAQYRPQILLCDIRTDLSPRALLRFKQKLSMLITLDDASDRRLVSDIALLPPTQAANELAWPDFRGEALIGWAWVVLASVPPRRQDVKTLREPPYQVLVTMGGADPAGLTLRVARNLRAFGENIMPHFVIGPAFAEAQKTIGALLGMWPCGRILQNLPDLSVPMSEADLAICAYGVTAQELAAAGVPALYLALSRDHSLSADALASTGAGLNLGEHTQLSDQALRIQVSRLMRNARAREQMSVAGPRAIDGRGAQRIAERINRAMKARAA